MSKCVPYKVCEDIPMGIFLPYKVCEDIPMGKCVLKNL